MTTTVAAFTGSSPETIPPDPTKHVRYTLGMILGADDFDAEFGWLSGRDRWLARDLIGYGTANGLRVTVSDGADPEVTVASGAAVMPTGQLVRVAPAQCANLNDWLAKNGARVSERIASPPAALPLYVVLCYDSCETDVRPIPGEPCRSEAEMMQPARIMDAFRLELRLDPPIHREERAIRQFVRWVTDTVEISEGPASPPSGTLEDFLDLLRHAVPTASPPASPPEPEFDLMSPPARFTLDRDDACDYLKAALRVWVTELRPRWHDDFAKASTCAGSSASSGDGEEC